jgi:hydrogenase-4 component B
MINIFLVILLISFTALFFAGTKLKGLVTLFTVILLVILSSIVSVRSLGGHDYNMIMEGSYLFGDVQILIDPLSAWFILTINFTFLTGAIYGLNYMSRYIERKSAITLHCISFLLAYTSMIGICSVQNGFIFLLLLELLAISVFLLVIFDYREPMTIKAGLNYLVQSHISLVFIMLGFIYVAIKTGHYGFDAIAEFSRQQSTLAGTALFLLFFTGFAVKSGFLPFHTWLPYAHPAAPSHVSGIMSGVVIKIGIYGILRMLLLIKTDYTTVGYFILIISIITGLYGVMLAIVQHDLKKLLAYHSIENIGIIGIGIGLGCIGLGSANKWMALLGFSGALLHTLNHSLFKSLLFYSAGNVMQAVHTLNVERLGGIMKKMPHTAILFLTAAIAICGLPPLNGFISEFLILGGLYNWLFSAGLISQIAIVFSTIFIVLIGGLAILCFTKAFSVVFLGTPRSKPENEISEFGFWRLLPMYLSLLFMIMIGLFPAIFLNILQRPVNLFSHGIVFDLNLIKVGAIDSLQSITRLSFGLIILVLIVLGMRRMVTRTRVIETGPTWGCGYSTAGSKLQYTAGSFVRSYAKLAKPILEIEKKDIEIDEVFPAEKHFETEPYDKVERIFIDEPLNWMNKSADMFLFLQNGQLQRYILYGIIFITGVLCIPLIIVRIEAILHFLNNL